MNDALIPAPESCAAAVRQMWELLDGGLGDVDRAEVEAHLAWCLRCCGELAFARELQQLLRTRTGGELPSDVGERLEQFIDGLDDSSDGVMPT